MFLPAPDLSFPQNPSELIGEHMHGGSPPVHTFPFLAAPAANQLIEVSESPIMHVWQATITDEAGNIAPSSTVEVRHVHNNQLATLFSDSEGEDSLANPFTVPASGLARFYASTGVYRIRAFLGASQQIWEDVELGVSMDSLPEEDLAAFIQETVSDQITEEVNDAVAAQVAEILETLETLSFAGVHSGFVTANGTGSTLPVGWTVDALGSGRYRINHNLDLADPQSLVITAMIVGLEDRYCIADEGQVSADFVGVNVIDVAGFGANNAFFFVAVNQEATTE